MKNKAIIREEILLKLRNFEKNEKESQTLEVLCNFITSKTFAEAQSIGLYMHMPTEFNLSELFRVCGTRKKQIYVPKTFPAHEMTFIELEEQAWTDYPKNGAAAPGQNDVTTSEENKPAPPQLAHTSRGILEPQRGQEGTPDLIVVPGLAWNFSGHRIGFGGGYYDRYLAKFKGNTVSLAYDFQRVEFEAEAHDIAVKEIFSV
jgi:5-formyltetrahydrofolate cyclo-ligase